MRHDLDRTALLVIDVQSGLADLLVTKHANSAFFDAGELARVTATRTPQSRPLIANGQG